VSAPASLAAGAALEPVERQPGPALGQDMAAVMEAEAEIAAAPTARPDPTGKDALILDARRLARTAVDRAQTVEAEEDVALMPVADRPALERHHEVGEAMEMEETHRPAGTGLDRERPAQTARHRGEAGIASAVEAGDIPGHRAPRGKAGDKDAAAVEGEAPGGILDDPADEGDVVAGPLGRGSRRPAANVAPRQPGAVGDDEDVAGRGDPLGEPALDHGCGRGGVAVEEDHRRQALRRLPSLRQGEAIVAALDRTGGVDAAGRLVGVR